jgi:hypothetical protein
MTAGELLEKLAQRFRVNKDKWQLVVFSNEKAPYILEKDAKIYNFISSKKERTLVFG